jgi:N-acetylglucosamine kinase-like BadF-type ATPase
VSAGRQRAHLLLAGIDGGQTSTKAVIARGDGTILGRGAGPACDHLNVPGGRDRNRVAIHTALREVCASAGVTLAELNAVGLGLTSAQRQLEPGPVIREIVREIAAPQTIWVDNDVISNLAGASAGQPGIVVIAGGGSVAYGIDAAGREAFSGGLGYLLGDDGSAWYLGIEALRAAARASDRRGPMTALLPMILAAWRLGDIREVLTVLYREGFQRSEVAALAPSVVRAASDGDPVASELVTRGASLLADHALGVAEQLDLAPGAVDIYPTGGIFGAGEIVGSPFERAVLARRPLARFHQPRFDPAIGALIRAAIDFRLVVDASFLATLATSEAMPR